MPADRTLDHLRETERVSERRAGCPRTARRMRALQGCVRSYGCGKGCVRMPAINSFKPASELLCRNL